MSRYSSIKASSPSKPTPPMVMSWARWATFRPPKANLQVEEGGSSSYGHVRVPPNVNTSMIYVQSFKVIFPTCGLPNHVCGILTSLLKTKPICPSCKVLKICEPLREGFE
jgi:hypothetical protein